jgi:hypothetical protein
MTGFLSETLRQIRYGDIDTKWIIFISFLIALITFPELSPIYSNGIDPPLSWVFNYLIHHNPELGKDIIFPHGPLAFVMYPLPVGYNLVITAVLYFLAKGLFAFFLLSARFAHGSFRMLVSLIFTAILLVFLDFLLVLIGIVLLGYLNYLQTRQWGWLVIPVLITSVAVYIKAFVGIVCMLLGIAFILILILEYLRNRKSVKIFIFIPFIPLCTMLVWLALYGEIEGITRYFKGMLELAGDNSAAVAYYPSNNWFILGSAALLTIVLVILHIKSRSARFILLVAPSLFALWKYGMAREDFQHNGMFFLFIAMIILVFILFVDRYYKVTVILGAAIIMLMYLNLQNALYPEQMKISVSGIRQVRQLLTDYEYFTDTCNVASERNTLRNKLDSSLRNLIGTATTDVYPWDYSFIAVNHLNWIPRPVLQSYACYTPWLDNQNAKHFSSATAPEFLIWELRKITHDIHDGTMESIDGRYLFNDQPETALSVLSHYRLERKQGGTFPVLLFRKRTEPLVYSNSIISTDTVAWNEWLDIPSGVDGLTRLKVQLNRNLAGDLKSFFYKDEACYIYYMLENNEIRMYRIVPENAVQGLWINPLLLNTENDLCETAVKKVMIRCSNPAMMSQQIPISWEQIVFNGKKSDFIDEESDCSELQRYFGKKRSDTRAVSVFSVNDMEKTYPFWSQNMHPDSRSANSGNMSCEIPSESYSMSFEIPLDTLLKSGDDTAWMIRTEMWAKSVNKADGSFVISIEANNEAVSWKGIRVSDFLIQKGVWNFVTNFMRINRKMLESQKLKLKVYAWNQGKSSYWIDDFKVTVRPD